MARLTVTREFSTIERDDKKLLPSSDDGVVWHYFGPGHLRIRYQHWCPPRYAPHPIRAATGPTCKIQQARRRRGLGETRVESRWVHADLAIRLPQDASLNRGRLDVSPVFGGKLTARKDHAPILHSIQLNARSASNH